MDYEISKFKCISDERGDLIVFLRNSDIICENKYFGQIYFVTFREKGTIRGNHYHKGIIEWFGIVHGAVKVILEDINSKEKISLILDSGRDEYIRLKIGVNIAHVFISLTPEASLLNYTNIEWSPDDSFPYKIEIE